MKHEEFKKELEKRMDDVARLIYGHYVYRPMGDGIEGIEGMNKMLDAESYFTKKDLEHLKHVVDMCNDIASEMKRIYGDD